MANLSAFADEVSKDFLTQVKFLVGENVRYIEPRFIDGKNILDLNESELKTVKNILSDNQIKISAIGSPIGKIRMDEPFAPHLDRFKHAVDVALFLGAKLIRIFSYYAPVGGNIFDYRADVMERMHKKVEIVKDVDIILCHENEAHIYGQSAHRCVDIAKTVNSPKLRLVYDPANFVTADGTADSIQSCWPIMKPYVNHIHIKDWKKDAKIGSMPGTGDGQIKQLLEELATMDYQGCLTMEPHLSAGGQFGGSTTPELYSLAIKAVRRIGEEVGLQIK